MMRNVVVMHLKKRRDKDYVAIKPSEVEKIAIEDAISYYKNLGYSLLSEKRRGCDLIFYKDGEKLFVEVKWRTRRWQFTNLSQKDVDLLKTEPNSILYEVVIDKQTRTVKERFIRSGKDIIREEPLGSRVYFRKGCSTNA